MKNEFTLKQLASDLPRRLNAAKHSGIDCVRLTLATVTVTAIVAG